MKTRYVMLQENVFNKKVTFKVRGGNRNCFILFLQPQKLDIEMSLASLWKIFKITINFFYTKNQTHLAKQRIALSHCVFSWFSLERVKHHF